MRNCFHDRIVRPRKPCCSPFICGMVQPQGAEEAVEDQHKKVVGTDDSIDVPKATFQAATPLPSPKDPTPEEIAKHMLTHLP